MRLRLEVREEGTEAAVAGLARSLLSSGAVDRVFMPHYDERGEAVYGTLVSNEPGLAEAAPFAPYLSGNKGREAGMAAPRDDRARTAVFLRPCEARAFVELSKLRQADRESVVLVTSDCPGTLSLDEYKRFREQYASTGDGVDGFYEPFRRGERLSEFQVRDCCTYCESLAHPDSDVRLLWVGAPEGELIVESGSEVGEAVLGKLELPESGPVDEERRKQFAEAQGQRCTELDAKWDEEISSVEDFLSILRYCRRCYNCRAECPICYCRECIFQTATFEVTPDAFGRRADTSGIIKMPPDTLVFHLTRLNHMATSCVSCGQCAEACPQSIPVGRIFTAVSRRVQAVFDYSAGTDPADELPQTVFREDELEPR